MVKDTELAWLAGILDGEGCIYSHWTNRKNASSGNVCVEVRIEATSLAMITRVAEVLDAAFIAHVVQFGRRQPKATKPSHRIDVRRRDEIVRMLKAVRPYLAVKLAEADAAIAWYERWGDQRGRNQERATLEEKLVFFDRLRALKRVA